jgi:hypothetical protein
MKKPELKAREISVFARHSQEAATVQDLIDACKRQRLDFDCVEVGIHCDRYEPDDDDDDGQTWGEPHLSVTTRMVTDIDRREYSLAREKYDAWAASDEGKAELKRRATEAKKFEKKQREEFDRTVLRQKVRRALDDANLKSLRGVAKALGVET